MSELWRRGLLFVACIGILAIVLVLIQTVQEGPTVSQAGRPQPLPTQTAPSAAALQQLAQTSDFQYLVSYNAQGFSPQTLTIKQGQSVRFVNNANGELWIAAIGSGNNQVYPGESSCGGSSFDSCQVLHIGDFWQFTFNSPGTWIYQNNVDTTQAGVVIVQ